MSEITKPNYEQLIANIGTILAEGRNRVATATTLLWYRHIGL